MQEGKLLHWGISEMPADYLRRAHKVCPVTAVENRYNVINREHEDLIPFLEENHIGWVAHGPMFKGLLSGTFQKGARFARDDWRSSSINDENLDRYGSLLQYLGALGKARHGGPAFPGLDLAPQALYCAHPRHAVGAAAGGKRQGFGDHTLPGGDGENRRAAGCRGAKLTAAHYVGEQGGGPDTVRAPPDVLRYCITRKHGYTQSKNSVFAPRSWRWP